MHMLLFLVQCRSACCCDVDYQCFSFPYHLMPSLCFYVLELKPLKRGAGPTNPSNCCCFEMVARKGGEKCRPPHCCPVSWRSLCYLAFDLGRQHPWNCQGLGFSCCAGLKASQKTPIDDAGGQTGKGSSIGCLRNPMLHLDVAVDQILGSHFMLGRFDNVRTKLQTEKK